MAREQIAAAIKNKVKFRFVLFDLWFSSVENMRFILSDKKHFICPLKSNRKIALSLADKLQGQWHKLENLEVERQHETPYLSRRIGNPSSSS
jgi:hypothetical protein